MSFYVLFFATIGHAGIIIIIIIIIIMQYTSTYFDSNLLISRTVFGWSVRFYVFITVCICSYRCRVSSHS